MTVPLPGDYAHQCRYCCNCVFTMEESWWCAALNIYLSNPLRANRCKDFDYNEIAADALDKKYKPRRRRAGDQLKMFDMKGGRNEPQEH